MVNVNLVIGAGVALFISVIIIATFFIFIRLKSTGFDIFTHQGFIVSTFLFLKKIILFPYNFTKNKLANINNPSSENNKQSQSVQNNSSPEEKISSAREKMEKELGEKLTSIKKTENKETPKEQPPKPEEPKSPQPLNIESLFSQIKETDLGIIFDTFDKNKSSEIIKKLSGIKFTSLDEFKNSLKTEIVEFIDDSYKELGNRASIIRKSGQDISEASLEIMQIPSKTKVFTATILKKDYDVVLAQIKKVDSELLEAEKKVQEAKAEKEKIILEKNKEQPPKPEEPKKEDTSKTQDVKEKTEKPAVETNKK